MPTKTAININGNATDITNPAMASPRGRLPRPIAEKTMAKIQQTTPTKGTNPKHTPTIESTNPAVPIPLPCWGCCKGCIRISS